MPASLPLAIFIFGAALLFIGLLGGSFKLFGAEVAGTVGPRVRVAALVLGVVFIILGMVSENRAPTTAPVAAPRTESAEPATLRTTSLPAPAPAPVLGDLTGIWNDEVGTVYQVWQSGDGYAFHATRNVNGMTFTADGVTRVQGLRWTNEFRTNVPSTGKGSGTISADGMQMTGNFRDTMIGNYSRTLNHER